MNDALYFSIVTFTTLGYGDIVLNEQWRLPASIQAAGGIIIFGWTTAIIVAVVQITTSRRNKTLFSHKRQIGSEDIHWPKFANDDQLDIH